MILTKVNEVTLTSIGDYAFYGCSNLASIAFEDTNTWYYGTSAQQEAMSGGTQLDLSDPSANARYLTSTYYSKYWHKV